MSAYRDLILGNNPIAYWRLGEPPGSSVIVDETGSFPGTVNGALTFGVPGPIVGDDDTALKFDNTGLDQWINVPDMPNPVDGNFTVEAWVYVQDQGSPLNRYIIMRRDNATGEEWSLRATRRIAFLVGGDGGILSVVGDADLDDGWYHVAVTLERGTGTGGTDILRLYLNGALVSTSSQDTVVGTCNPTESDGLIGRYSTSTTFGMWSGILDEVAIYDYALSAEQIEAHYTQAQPAFPGIESNLAIQNYANVGVAPEATGHASIQQYANVGVAPEATGHASIQQYANVGADMTTTLDRNLIPYHYGNVLGGIVLIDRVHRSAMPAGVEPYRGDWALRVKMVGVPEEGGWSYPVGNYSVIVDPYVIREEDAHYPLRLIVRAASLDEVFADPDVGLFAALVALDADGDEIASSEESVWDFEDDPWEPGVWQSRTVFVSAIEPIASFVVRLRAARWSDDDEAYTLPVSFDEVYLDMVEIDAVKPPASPPWVVVEGDNAYLDDNDKSIVVESGDALFVGQYDSEDAIFGGQDPWTFEWLLADLGEIERFEIGVSVDGSPQAGEETPGEHLAIVYEDGNIFASMFDGATSEVSTPVPFSMESHRYLRIASNVDGTYDIRAKGSEGAEWSLLAGLEGTMPDVQPYMSVTGATEEIRWTYAVWFGTVITPPM